MSYDVVRRGDPLTEKEHEVMALMAKGATQPDAAERIGVSAHTVKFHLGRIFKKLGARNIVHAAVLWTQQQYALGSQVFPFPRPAPASTRD